MEKITYSPDHPELERNRQYSIPCKCPFWALGRTSTGRRESGCDLGRPRPDLGRPAASRSRRRSGSPLQPRGNFPLWSRTKTSGRWRRLSLSRCGIVVHPPRRRPRSPWSERRLRIRPTPHRLCRRRRSGQARRRRCGTTELPGSRRLRREPRNLLWPRRGPKTGRLRSEWTRRRVATWRGSRTDRPKEGFHRTRRTPPARGVAKPRKTPARRTSTISSPVAFRKAPRAFAGRFYETCGSRAVGSRARLRRPRSGEFATRRREAGGRTPRRWFRP